MFGVVLESWKSILPHRSRQGTGYPEPRTFGQHCVGQLQQCSRRQGGDFSRWYPFGSGVACASTTTSACTSSGTSNGVESSRTSIWVLLLLRVPARSSTIPTSVSASVATTGMFLRAGFIGSVRVLQRVAEFKCDDSDLG